MLNHVGVQHRHREVTFWMLFVPLGDRLDVGIAMDSGENPESNPFGLSVGNQRGRRSGRSQRRVSWEYIYSFRSYIQTKKKVRRAFRHGALFEVSVTSFCKT